MQESKNSKQPKSKQRAKIAKQAASEASNKQSKRQAKKVKQTNDWASYQKIDTTKNMLFEDDRVLGLCGTYQYSPHTEDANIKPACAYTAFGL